MKIKINGLILEVQEGDIIITSCNRPEFIEQRRPDGTIKGDYTWEAEDGWKVSGQEKEKI